MRKPQDFKDFHMETTTEDTEGTEFKLTTDEHRLTQVSKERRKI
jgi:hypothetical protein